ncbi:Sorting nexin-30 [Taenia crassiceps]|uniref:Sorting nexin-30 n=1 Tax=Taenia crassiceps TaxID=6207 RepID=A0ABR4QAN7_9CEST
MTFAGVWWSFLVSLFPLGGVLLSFVDTMLEESEMSGRLVFNIEEVSTGSGVNAAPPSLPATNEICARITGVRKLVTNYETYIVYEIETVANRKGYPSEACIVDRRYREFDWLYNRLRQKAYWYLLSPPQPLPGKKVLTQFNRYASGFVDRRCSSLQTFLRRSTAHPVLSGNNDFVAFLTLSRAAFQEYVQENPTESSLLFSLIGLSPQGQTRGSSSVGYFEEGGRGAKAISISPRESLGPVPDASNTIPVVRASGGEAVTFCELQHASEAFLRYQKEVDEYAVLCQRLSNLVNRMTNQLSTLSYDHAELAKTLEETVVAGAVGATGAEVATGLAAVQAVRRTAQAMQSLASRLALGPANAWHDSAAFGAAVKRDTYFDLEHEIEERQRSETNGGVGQVVTTEDRSGFHSPGSPVLRRCRGSVPVKEEQATWRELCSKKSAAKSIRCSSRIFTFIAILRLAQLQSAAAEVARELAFSNSQVEAEWRRWRATRAAETTESLTALTGAYVAYWDTVSEAWRNAATFLKAPPPSTQPSVGASLRGSPQHVKLESNGDLWNVPPCTANPNEEEAEKKQQEWSVVDLLHSPSRSPSTPFQPGGVDAEKAVGDVLSCFRSDALTYAVEGGKEGNATASPSGSHPLDISGAKDTKECWTVEEF